MLRRFVRLILRILRRFRQETSTFRKSLRDVIQGVIDKIINFIQLKYHCIKVRRRMGQAQSYPEWEAYARLCDHLEGTEKWKYEAESDCYDHPRLQQRT